MPLNITGPRCCDFFRYSREVRVQSITMTFLEVRELCAFSAKNRILGIRRMENDVAKSYAGIGWNVTVGREQVHFSFGRHDCA